jgi:tetratricopeptide (TPR) repeat protein
MKALLPLTLLVSFPAVAADFPVARDRIADCENQWFLLEGQNPALRILGFAYVDPSAGVTIEHNGEVGIGPDGSLERKPFELKEKARLIIRATGNYEIVCLNEAQRTQLGLPVAPEWQGAYRDSRAAGPHNVSWASHYNHIGAFDRALKHIEAALSEKYTSRDLTFEYGFALNAVERFHDALAVLEPGVESYPRDVNIRAELGFAHLGLGDFKKAIEIYERAYNMDKSGSSGRRGEFAQNVAAAYARLGDEKSATRWLSLARQATPKE